MVNYKRGRIAQLVRAHFLKSAQKATLQVYQFQLLQNIDLDLPGQRCGGLPDHFFAIYLEELCYWMTLFHF